MLNPATVRPRRKVPGSCVRLPDGARISIRPIRADDAEAFARAYTRLSDLSRERRYLSLSPVLRPADVRYLTAVDHHEHVALVALDPSSREIVGSARYIRLPTRPGVAEIAIEVIDEWQRRGVGRVLLGRLSRHAQDAGVKHFIAIVSTGNLPMQRMLTRTGALAARIDGELEYNVHVGALTPRPRRARPATTRSPERRGFHTLIPESAPAV